jgi:hypothetical protein
VFVILRLQYEKSITQTRTQRSQQLPVLVRLLNLRKKSSGQGNRDQEVGAVVQQLQILDCHNLMRLNILCSTSQKESWRLLYCRFYTCCRQRLKLQEIVY